MRIPGLPTMDCAQCHVPIRKLSEEKSGAMLGTGVGCDADEMPVPDNANTIAPIVTSRLIQTSFSPLCQARLKLHHLAMWRLPWGGARCSALELYGPACADLAAASS